MGHYLKLHEPKGGVPIYEDDPHSILRRWRIEFVPNLDDKAIAHFSRHLIEVRQRNYLDMLTDLFHEVHHVGNPDAEEAPVLRVDLNHIRVFTWFVREFGSELFDEITGGD